MSLISFIEMARQSAGGNFALENFSSPTLVDFPQTGVFEDESSHRGRLSEPRTNLPLEVPRIPRVLAIKIVQSDSVTNSLDQFIARKYRQIPQVSAVYRQRIGDGLCFYVITSDDEEEGMDAVFELEKLFYGRLAVDQLDFQILPGADLEPCVPSSAVLLWRR